MTSVDGVQLRQSWNAALDNAQTQLQSLLTSTSLWRRVPSAGPDNPQDGSSSNQEESQVMIHKRPSKQGEIFRLVLDIPADGFSIAAWRAVLATPEMRQEWDPAVESSQLLELLEVDVRIVKTYFTLGWPANPRDAVTISRTLSDGATLLDVTTSLPRSPDEPPYLRPTPPYVRSHVHLFAWVIQQVPSPTGANVRLTCFWQHDLKAVWGLGMPSRVQHLSSLMIGAVKAVNRYGTRIPSLQGYGLGVGMERMAFDVGRQSLTVEYSILHEGEGDDLLQGAPRGMDEVRARKEKRRLEKSLEFILPKQTSWDVQLLIRASTTVAASSPWAVKAYSDKDGFLDPEQLLLRARHSLPSTTHAVIRVKMVIEAAGGTAGNLRLNGVPLTIEDLELRDPTPLTIPEPLLQDASNVGDITFQSPSGTQSQFSDVASRTISVRTNGRTEGSQKSILKLVKRNYVYFSSLIQEPEMKWKPLVEARGVSVTQLDSIDPTLVVYKAEAVFVGVGMWDLISVICTPGATMYWDKSFDGANLLEDVSELSQLWHHKTKAAWPVNARESVLLRSTYKSPTSVHIFSFSTDDTHLFPSIPASDPSVIRTQVDLRGWAIEALSPTTTQVTLIEQSDPKGWSNKSSLPQQIIAAVSGVGEFVIKSGGPPVLSRLGGARALINKYDFERANFRLEYEVDPSRRATDPQESTPAQSSIDLSDTITSGTPPSRPFAECELRCDIETWGGPIDVVVDPPPQSVSCLRRHRLSENGGGLWITIEHDADFVASERLKVVIRKGASSTAKEKNTVLVNGAKTKVEVEEMPETDIKQLTKRKRVKPIRIPLDQPPVVGAIRRKRAEWAVDSDGRANTDDGLSDNTSLPIQTGSTLTGNTFGRLVSMAFSQATSSTSTAMSAVAKPFALTEQTVPSASKLSMQHSLDALAYLRSSYTRPSQEGWVQVADNGGLAVFRKLETEVSRTIPVHKASKVIEGVTAEEVIHALSLHDCRKQWDDRFDSAVVLQDYGYGCQTSFTVVKGAFPFQPRGFYTASTLGRSSTSAGSPSNSRNEHAVYYHATTSFNPDSVKDFSSRKYNPSNYAIGRVLLRGWICETLDPYTSENYAIPSTRCTFVSAVDFAGAVPVTYNAMLNASLPRAILRLENYLKSNSNLPFFHNPNIGIAIEPTEGPQEGWSFQRRDAGTILVARSFGHEKREYQATVVIDPISIQPSNQTTDITPTPSRLIPQLLPPSPTQAENFPRLMDFSVSPPGAYAPIQDLGRPKSPDRPSFRDSSIGRRNQFAPSSSMERRKPLPSFSASSSLVPKDFLVADIVVDSKLYPQGFDVRVSPGLRVPEEYADLAHSYLSGEGPLPLSVTVYALSNSLYRSSYSERSGSRHLVRLSLPTARFEGAPLEDPLSGQVRSPPPRPSWLLEIMEKGAIVDISLLPLDATANSPTSQNGGFRVTHNGQPVDIISERKALTMLGKDGSDHSLTMPWVLRSDDAMFPRELATPIAIAKQCLVDPVPEVAEQKAPESAVEAHQTSESIPTEADAFLKPEVPSTPRQGLGSLFNTYTSWWPKKVSTVPTAPVANSQSGSGPEGENKPQLSELTASANGTAIRMTSGRTRGVPLHIVFIIAFICFLLGSLVRSILSPADFIIAKGPEELVDFDERQWRRFSRLVEFKWIWRGNDLIIGIAHA